MPLTSLPPRWRPKLNCKSHFDGKTAEKLLNRNVISAFFSLYTVVDMLCFVQLLIRQSRESIWLIVMELGRFMQFARNRERRLG